MSWWQILLVIASQIMCWYVGKQAGYLDGWYARGIADDERFIERAKQAAASAQETCCEGFSQMGPGWHSPSCPNAITNRTDRVAASGEESAP